MSPDGVSSECIDLQDLINLLLSKFITSIKYEFLIRPTMPGMQTITKLAVSKLTPVRRRNSDDCKTPVKTFAITVIPSEIPRMSIWLLGTPLVLSSRVMTLSFVVAFISPCFSQTTRTDCNILYSISESFWCSSIWLTPGIKRFSYRISNFPPKLYLAARVHSRSLKLPASFRVNLRKWTHSVVSKFTGKACTKSIDFI